jgi:glycosyltransferase involved in cell wall biosynthesis
MRIGFDARYIRWDHHDGISRFSAGLAHELALLLAQRSDDELVFIISDDRQRALLPHGETVSVTSPTSWREPRVARHLNSADLDVVFSPMQTMGSRGRNYRLVLTVHDLIYYRHRTPPPQFAWPLRLLWRLYHLSWAPQRWLLNRSDAVVAVSQTTAGLVAAHRLSRRPVFVVPNAADRPAGKRAPQPFIARARRAVYMGSFMPYKNVSTLVKAAELSPDWEFHFLSRIDGKTRRELESLAPRTTLFFHNGTPESEYRELLSTSRALVSSSLDEGFGIPLIEAMAEGTPVVVSDIGIFHEVAGDAALFAPATDAHAFAAALAQLDDEKTWAASSKKAMKQAEKFSWQASAARLLDVLDQVGSARGRGERL